ncbi:hydroxymethylglutaryl-CoA lyase [Luteibaculum oceani]|uniref:Hydroxymethylglutaryl-CoA lyase n=1 Tax=Luteibaculum oceani TaxID=1294296 RepID=A0A5C6VBS1_9FLAO|nr:hydroxymethylglutaryl-CoA lyase [Luteibaculum oceani]TXC82161.1 hydroxymethylglutaryl-CoA lyase [Luteibaculum oceani]
MDIIVTECPRDAMQGISEFIPTEKKIAYLNKLLDVGFPVLDFGSFVSPKAIPQLADTAKVLEGLKLNDKTKLLAIVANERGCNDAVQHEEISFIGYPFSVSETFQKRNTNAGIEESLIRLEAIKTICDKHQKKLVVYLSMAFGNPYGDKWHPDIVTDWAFKLKDKMEIAYLAPSDTIGSADEASIKGLFTTMITELPTVEIGAHLHATPDDVVKKVAWAYEAGCRKFDGALKGYGGCPMAKDDLTGNMDTEKMLSYFDDLNLDLGLNKDALHEAALMTNEIF